MIIIDETMTSSHESIQNLNALLNSYKVILQKDESNTDSLQATTNDLESTSENLNEIIDEPETILLGNRSSGGVFG